MSNKHYKQYEIEVIEMIEMIAERYDGHNAFIVGNIIKYLARAPFKNQFSSDIKKAYDYSAMLHERVGDPVDENQCVLFNIRDQEV